MPYEVRSNTSTDGWTNTWLYVGADGRLRPETFATREEAEEAIIEHLLELQYELRPGQSLRYRSDDFRIAYVPEQHHQEGRA